LRLRVAVWRHERINRSHHYTWKQVPLSAPQRRPSARVIS
jgi:hypothetical protein